jgi:hypothetical protein
MVREKNLPLDLYYVMIFLDLDEVSALKTLKQYRFPRNISSLLTKFNILDSYDFGCRRDVDSEILLKGLKRIDAYRKPIELLQLCRLSDALQRNCDTFYYFNQAHEKSKHVNFNSLSNKEQNTLKGLNIGKAIDQQRLIEINKYLNEERCIRN